MENKLKPCPSCGAPGVELPNFYENGVTAYGCTKCSITADTLEDWQARTSDPKLEKIRKIVDSYWNNVFGNRSKCLEAIVLVLDVDEKE